MVFGDLLTNAVTQGTGFGVRGMAQGGELYIIVRSPSSDRVTQISGLAEPGRRLLLIAAAGPDETQIRILADALVKELEQSQSAPGLVVQKAEQPGLDWTALPDVELSLLVAVSTGQPWVEEPWQETWLASEERALIALPLSLQRRTSQLFGGRLQKLNAAFWRTGVEELVHPVLARLHYVSDIPRIFISYRRDESQALANQLFDALTRRNFEVFLDHVTIPPGIFFQRRLAQQLGDKSVVLVIESKEILDSEWTRYEIATAQINGLALIALQVPGGVVIPSIDASRRINLKMDEFKIAWSAEAELKPERLEDVVLEIIAAHDRGLRWRYALIRRTIADAFAAEGLQLEAVGRTTLRAEGGNGRKYQFWICPRSPEIDDFYSIGLQCAAVNPADHGAVVSTVALMEPAGRQRFDWLSKLSTLNLYDVREVSLAARAIKSGTF